MPWRAKVERSPASDLCLKSPRALVGSLPGCSRGWGGLPASDLRARSGGLGSEGRSQHVPLTAEEATQEECPWRPVSPASILQQLSGGGQAEILHGTTQAVGAAVAGYGRNCPGGRPPATPHRAPPAPSPRERLLTTRSRPPLPSFLGPGKYPGEARDFVSWRRAPRSDGVVRGAQGPALWLCSDGGRLALRRAVCPCGCCFSELCAENGTLGATCGLGSQRGPCALPCSPSEGGLRMLGLPASRQSLAVIWLLGPAQVPGTAGRSWVMGVSGSELPHS